MIQPEEFLTRVAQVVEKNHVLLNHQHWDESPYDMYEFVTDNLNIKVGINFTRDHEGTLVPSLLECSYEDATFDDTAQAWPDSTWVMSIIDVMDHYNLPAMQRVTSDQFIEYFVSEFNRNLAVYAEYVKKHAKQEAQRFRQLAIVAMQSQSDWGMKKFDKRADLMKRLQSRYKIAHSFRLG